MPPKKKFSREQIIAVSFEIARTEGIGSITIRKVAEKLKSSIAPIYVNFKNVDELIQAVIKKTFAISQQILDQQCSGNAFEDIGLASLQFAREYPVLFRDLVINQNDYLENYDQDMGPVLIEQMKDDPDLEGFTEEELLTILLKMRIFQTGLSVMVSNGLLGEKEENAAELLREAAQDVICAARMRKNSTMKGEQTS
ncbi:MAG: TetR/AcrR family transcriptional regulator [Bacillota bacterium]|nr:TetR/AcrR family transcriptional regulator [Bacillota bacterium]MDW7683567.1 TetR/AcrR family transcriptional regulator [Bacillota bacterium]